MKLIVYESPVRVGRELSYRKNIGLIILEGRVQKKENIVFFYCDLNHQRNNRQSASFHVNIKISGKNYGIKKLKRIKS